MAEGHTAMTMGMGRGGYGRVWQSMIEYGRGPGLWHCQVYDIACTLPLLHVCVWQSMIEYGRGPGLWHCQVYDIVCTLPVCIRELNEYNRAQTVNYDIISIPFCRKANKERQ